MIKVSVIMPVYNAEKYLEKTLECLIHQTLKEIEIICIDDGSMDQSGQILDRYRQLDQRVIILSQKNAGAGAARNLGLKYASGEYLSILDADDVFELEMLEASYIKAKRDHADICVFKMDKFTEGSRHRQSCHWSLSRSQLPDYEPFTYRDLSGNIFKVFVGWTWDKLFRREFVHANGILFQSIRTSNDLFFTFTALVKAKRISTLSRTLIHQRVGIKNSLSVTREKSWDCFYQALLALREELVRVGVYEEVERSFVNYALHFSLWNLNSLSMPAFEKLYEKLVGEYFVELGVQGKDQDYFWDQEEYWQYEQIRKMTPEDYRVAYHSSKRDQQIQRRAYEVQEECERAYTGMQGYSGSRKCMEREYQVGRYHAYRNAFDRVLDDEKWEFVCRMREAFQEACRKQELVEEVFDDSEWDEVQELITQPEDYYVHRYAQRQAEIYAERIMQQEQEIDCIKNSKRWKMGSAIAYIPQKILKGKGDRKN